MASVTAFHYFPGTSLLHRWDPRCKLACLAGVSLAAVGAGPMALAGLSLLCFTGFALSRVPFFSLARDLKVFFVFVLFIVGFQGASIPGKNLVDLGFLSFTQEGVYHGGMLGWRLLLMVLCGALFAATTRPAQVKASVSWLFKPVPLVPHEKLAMMMGLMVRFVPQVLEEAGRVLEAQKARCVEKRRNPVYRLKKLGPPLLFRTFLRAEDLSLALAARGFSENRTPPAMAAGIWDLSALAAVLLACAAFRLFAPV